MSRRVTRSQAAHYSRLHGKSPHFYQLDRKGELESVTSSMHAHRYARNAYNSPTEGNKLELLTKGPTSSGSLTRTEGKSKKPTPSQRKRWGGFWSRRIVDHMNLMPLVVRLSGLMGASSLLTEANKLAQEWKTFSSVASGEQKDLIEKTLAFKSQVRDRLSKVTDPVCWTDLLTHMLDELRRVGLLLRVVPSLHASIKEWAEEHQSAEEYLLCQVPKWLDRAASVLLAKMARENTKIANGFKMLQTSTRGSLDLKKEFMRLSDLHMKNAQAFLNDILPQLPMKAERKEFLHTLVEHESKEAVWVRSFLNELE